MNDRPRFSDRHLPPVDWHVSQGLVDYAQAVAIMHARAGEVATGNAPELIWLLEHPPMYTAGTSTRIEDLLTPGRLPLHRSGRGGQLTYHGPGQRIVYVVLNVGRRGADVRAFVAALEGWIIDTLSVIGVPGETRPGRVGIWVGRPDKGDGRDDKIAAIGLRLRRWVSLHGLSLNVDPDLEHYRGIIPCGVRNHGVTSLADLGVRVPMAAVDDALRQVFETRFGAIRRVSRLSELAPGGAAGQPQRST